MWKRYIPRLVCLRYFFVCHCQSSLFSSLFSTRFVSLLTDISTPGHCSFHISNRGSPLILLWGKKQTPQEGETYLGLISEVSLCLGTYMQRGRPPVSDVCIFQDEANHTGTGSIYYFSPVSTAEGEESMLAPHPEECWFSRVLEKTRYYISVSVASRMSGYLVCA